MNKNSSGQCADRCRLNKIARYHEVGYLPDIFNRLHYLCRSTCAVIRFKLCALRLGCSYDFWSAHLTLFPLDLDYALHQSMIPLTASHPAHNGQPPPAMAAFPVDVFNATNSSWNTNQEIVRLLNSACNHPEWLTHKVTIRPQTGSQYMFRRLDGNWFKMDGYEWKKRREGKLIREDHMKLKV
ncbi:CG-1 domain protein [Dictyocaulus viviparus]|uniref:CG-1 domain protein n=1 Tax=Dictyocaulus viviparus TaxID=29172 RepID=A0A0D8XAK2_DICVI|nr:CG-1 domain protein [Dictyocaulus viviparus]